MKILYTFFIFVLLLFCYIHILFHLKKNNDLEIYHLQNPTKEKLDKMISLKAPFLLTLEENIFPSFITKEYSTYDIKIRNREEKGEIKYLPLSLQKSLKIFKQDKKGIYFSEKNQEFLKEISFNYKISSSDLFLRPPLLCNSEYDFLIGSNKSYTPLRYEISYCNFILVNEGEIKIKIGIPKNCSQLHIEKDYENLDFYSDINIWENEDKKLSFLEISLKEKECFFIPPYWWYSIQFSKKANLFLLKYYTFMNNITILPEIALSQLQKWNIQNKYYKKIK